ncbi:hypothetical protein PV387_39390 [Streptomyces sp. ME02-6987-2C]|uniref:hypothetical protein n=1 Tax=unclassified Streptomyces TaxID=2593676 RepID=UPI0029AC3E49|nr:MULTISPECIES: hypothetical protein [unclassified Streptomyces]MDX3345933.1 hypothetical protein [Streptomyces sp. ME02-6979A]MDX3371983.1 hypothetical protein [Streptomyces sp. ME02-6987-2C]MDX3412207.1 hypothetical protein [Streptomyces sp. ME02-6977A]MDX3421699.1 hypothetical protein [Streptomyces sp. ME02-6985-2c]
MFRETVTHAGGDSNGTAGESHALMLLRRALNRGYAMEATLTGGACIRWTRADLSRAIVVRSIVLDPETPVGDFDGATCFLLARIGVGDARYAVHPDRRVIAFDDGEIAPAETARLRARRLVAVDGKGAVRLTLSARLGLLAHDHRQAGGGTDGFAMCSCGFTASGPTGEAADEVLRNHRQVVTASFVDSISAAYAAAVSTTH